jgi:hypothetical protein
MDNFPSIINRLKIIRENGLHYSSDLLNRDKDNDGVIDRYDADERDSKVQEIGDLSKRDKLKRKEEKFPEKNGHFRDKNERSR